ncbi:hypothetical protein [Bacillus sp. 1P06AnD]|uniref:UPF0738 family protein n=1 Tax=Bacillus sp. 1P06AnD TaxID=3132208 RepID=UPI0039A2023C
MRKIIDMKEVHIEQNKLMGSIQMDSPSTIKPKGQMLVDSDQFALVYIIEYMDEYVYLSFGEGCWPALNNGMQAGLPVYVKHSGKEIELIDFMEELAYLIDNIKDNANYGDEMGNKVEQVFL